MKSGDLFERTFSTAKGDIGFLAEVMVQGKVLHLKDVVVFEESGKVLTGLTREVLAARTALIGEAIGMGFTGLRITGLRLATSSSAHPGHAVDIFIDLTKYSSP
ncbi:MAG TPA: hypothetical protein PK867_28840 [Pirellulales bacterium]|nr:hypothetical protein [Pirellulales bacterium]